MTKQQFEKMDLMLKKAADELLSKAYKTDDQNLVNAARQIMKQRGQLLQQAIQAGIDVLDFGGAA